MKRFFILLISIPCFFVFDCNKIDIEKEKEKCPRNCVARIGWCEWRCICNLPHTEEEIENMASYKYNKPEYCEIYCSNYLLKQKYNNYLKCRYENNEKEKLCFIKCFDDFKNCEKKCLEKYS